ncbi:MAG: DUF2336 domain-containing protein [Pseudomonadota bacterium]
MSEFDAASRPPIKATDTLLTPMDSVGASARALMVRKLSDIVVLPTGRISSNERSLVADILLQVVEKVEPEIRKELARRIARVSECPPALLRILILDEPDVAREILEGADTVPAALLIEAAHEGKLAHRKMIAARKDLTAAVADAVLQFDEIDVCKLVLKRQECTISPIAVNKLVAQSASAPDLQPLLLRRTELEPAHGFLMFWWVDAERRRRILARFSLDRGTIQDALADLYARVFRANEPDPLVREILLLAERRHRPRGVDGEPVSAGVIMKTLAAARRHAPDEVIEAVAMIAGVSRDLAARILRDPGGEPLAIMCKSLGVPRDDFFEIYYVPTEDEGQAREKAEYLLGVFDSMARDFCRAVLHYWDWDGNPRIAHITRLLAMAEDGIADTAF